MTVDLERLWTLHLVYIRRGKNENSLEKIYGNRKEFVDDANDIYNNESFCNDLQTRNTCIENRRENFHIIIKMSSLHTTKEKYSTEFARF